MPLSYQNIINTNKLKDAIAGTGSFSDVIKKTTIEPRYIQGYADDTFWEAVANKLGVNKGIVQQLFGLENRRLDDYDPYHTSDAKIENFFDTDAKSILSKYDENTFTFKNSLYNLSKYEDYRKWNQFLYEDPLLPGFQLYIDPLSPLFSDSNQPNSIQSFLTKYATLDEIGVRQDMWNAFRAMVYTIFDTIIGGNNLDEENNLSNMPYFINKIEGLDNLKKKMIKFGEDKISITLNENIAMISMYLAELYNTLVYSYKNQRYMFPENVIRFNLIIKINDVRNFLIPQTSAQPNSNNPVNNNNLNTVAPVSETLSQKSTIFYTLHDCNFNFFNSTNFGDSIEMGGYGAGAISNPASLGFDIFFKSVTRWSTYPLIFNSKKIDAWGDTPFTDGTNETSYFEDMDRLKTQPPEKKSFLNQEIRNMAQTATNIALDYADNLEAYLRDLRGGLVEGALQSVQDSLNISKIEPDNVYNKDFNNRISLSNLGNQLAAGLTNDLSNDLRNVANF